MRILGSLLFASIVACAGGALHIEVSKPDVFVAEPFVLTYTYTVAGTLETRFVPPSLNHVAVLARRHRSEGNTTQEVLALAALTPGRIVIEGAGINTAWRRFEKDAKQRWQSKVAWRRERFDAVAVRAKAIPEDTEGVGRFDLHASLDRNVTHPGEPVTLTVTLDGAGNVDDIVEIKPQIAGVSVVPSEPLRHYRIADGTVEANLTQRFTLVAEKSFVVPSIVLRMFDPVSKKRSLLSTQPLAVGVVQSATGRRDNDLKETKMNVSLLFLSVTAVIAAAAGFVLGFAAARYRRRSRLERNVSDSMQARFVALLRHIDDPEARACAEAIEKQLYEGAEAPENAWVDAVIARLKTTKR